MKNREKTTEKADTQRQRQKKETERLEIKNSRTDEVTERQTKIQTQTRDNKKGGAEEVTGDRSRETDVKR